MPFSWLAVVHTLPILYHDPAIHIQNLRFYCVSSLADVADLFYYFSLFAGGGKEEVVRASDQGVAFIEIYRERGGGVYLRFLSEEEEEEVEVVVVVVVVGTGSGAQGRGRRGREHLCMGWGGLNSFLGGPKFAASKGQE